ncbi:MFS transporter [Clostridium sp. KNHs216]|uniref:MFS transporter n=1 Tax=Eubacteriales TaxID=186802 RepID=UPI00115301F0|nr:MFS transporter [Clostridium sp. KNHs216]TQI65415.1 sugar phosphate permease [Clostridium sp. KNHs216]
MNKAFIKKYGTLLLLAAGAGIIFQLPYIRETFYVQIQNAMQLTNEQMGLLSSGYASMALLSYFVGGMIADKFSARKLLTFSFITTGILGLWFSMFPGYNVCRIIFVLMGISTIITYWSACIKATRMLGSSEEQGRLFGLQEGLRGIMNALLVFGMMAAYNHFADKVLGAQWAIRVCAIVVIIIGVLNWFFIEDTKREENSEGILDIAKGMLHAMKLPRVWVICAIVFTAYSIYGMLGYLNTYCVKVYGAPESVGTTLGAFRYVIQAIGGVLGGFLADKIGSRIKVIIGSAVLFIASFLGFLVLPESAAVLNVVIVNFIFGLFIIYVVRSMYFAIIDDAHLPVNSTGRVSGFVSFLGYSPDIFMYTMIGSWMDANPGKAGYNMMFVYALVMAALCCVFAFVLFRIVKKDEKKAGSTETA